MAKKIRSSIRVKLTIMTMITIAIAAITLGVFLLVQFSNSAYQTASSTLSSVSENAYLALENSLSSAETSMKLLANQIGNDTDFANNITEVSHSEEAKKKVSEAFAGKNGLGDGSSLIGAMEYLVLNDVDIESVTMYSPYFESGNLFNRLKPVSESHVPFADGANYNKLIEKPGKALWFFQNDDLYVWKAVINFGVNDPLDIEVVGYMEYQFNRASFLRSLTDTKYENEGMLLIDDKGQVVLNVASNHQKVDEKILNEYASLNGGVERKSNYTACKKTIASEDWTYISYINHRSIDKTTAEGRNVTILIVSISVFVAALVAYLMAAREIKRIKNLSKAASSISRGDYDVRLKTTSNDEITDVGESFNSMAGKIQEVLEELILQQDSISENFATILSNKSGESGNHVKRVSEYSAILASELGFNDNDVHDIRIASMLHDVGKIMVDESILHKPGRFTDEEYKIMQQHVVYGGQLLKGVPGNIMHLGAIIAEYHHERYDGKGYVKGLVGDEIPKEAQITSVADVFDALVSKRCYKGAWTIEEAYQEIVNQSGKQFAPDVVEAFQRRFEDFKHISEIYKEEE